MADYKRRSSGDPYAPTHKQDTFRDKGGKVRNVDRKMRSTAIELNQRGIQTRYSDQGDFRVRNKEKDAYIMFNDAGNKRLKGLPKRFEREHQGRNKWNPEASTVRFRGGPVVGTVNRHRVRREAKSNVYKSAFGIEHTITKAFRKLNPKLLKADKAFQSRPRKNGAWVRENYVQWRSAAGGPGPRSLGDRIMDKEGARAMVTAAGNQSKRAGRKLP